MSCSHKKYYPTPMQQAERCVTTSPDSALFYLSILKEKINQESEETQMYYHLLTIKANDKLYIPHTSDSLIKAIVQFYEDDGDDEKLMEAYYYLGSVYRDMHDAPHAVEAFQQVLEIGKEYPNDLIARTYNQLGNLLAYQRLYHECLEVNKKAAEYYLSRGIKDKGCYATRDMARMYNAMHQDDSAAYYYEKAYQMTLSSQDSVRTKTILNELGCFYKGIGQVDTAKQILLKTIPHKESMGNVFLCLGSIYLEEKKYDSAYYYFNKILIQNDIRKKSYAYQYLFELETERKNNQQAIDYIRKALILKDSIDVITQTEAIAKISSLYNYQHTERENIKLKLKNENQKSAIYQLMLALVIISFISTSAFLLLKKRKKAALEQERKIRLVKEQQYAQSINAIEDNQTRLKELELQLDRVEKQNDSLQKQLLQAQKESLESSNRHILAARNEQELQEASFKLSDIYLLFHKAGNNETIKITEDSWTALRSAIDQTYLNFTDRLYSLYPQLSPMELRICYLIKISISVKEIAILVNRSKPAITASRTRLYKKIHGTEGNAEMFDRFIIDF